jgi:hypothetical protein
VVGPPLLTPTTDTNGTGHRNPVADRPKLSTQVRDRLGQLLRHLLSSGSRPSWCPRILTTMSDHNEAGSRRTLTDWVKGTCPGQRRFPTMWAYLTSEGSGAGGKHGRICDGRSAKAEPVTYGSP